MKMLKSGGEGCLLFYNALAHREKRERNHVVNSAIKKSQIPALPFLEGWDEGQGLHVW